MTFGWPERSTEHEDAYDRTPASTSHDSSSDCRQLAKCGLFSEEKHVSLFVHHTDEERHAAVARLSDADLVGRYWRLEDLAALTADERYRLKSYRFDTFGYENYCEKLVAHRPRDAADVANLTTVLDRWDAAFYNLRLWHLRRSVNELDHNPIAKVLIYEESRITGVRARLHVGVAAPLPQPAEATIPGATPRTRVGSKSSASQPRPSPEGINAVTELAASVAVLAEAINRLAEAITRT